jgi:hypothetical protein
MKVLRQSEGFETIRGSVVKSVEVSLEAMVGNVGMDLGIGAEKF